MRLTLLLLTLFAPPLFAQADRYELGKKVHALEVAWDLQPPTAAAKHRATPLIDQAVKNFFRFDMPAAAKCLDDARHALVSADAPAAGVRWADAVAVQPGTRLLDASTTEWPVTLKLFYKPAEAAPDKPVARVTVGAGKPQEFPLDSLPATLPVSLKDNPAPPTADLPVVVTILSGGKSLAVKTTALARVENLEKRLAKAMAAPKPATPTIESATQAHITKLLTDLAAKGTPETDYPAARLTFAAEKLASMKGPYYGVGRGGDYWLAFPTKGADAVARVRVPEDLAKDKPVPVVVALHGAGGSENMYFDAYGNGAVPRQAAQRGWIVVAPRVNGLFGVGGAPDVPAILDQLAARYPIDKTKVFLVGHSMGAGHAMQLVQREPKRYAGVAALGGGGKVGKSDAVEDIPFFIGCGNKDFAFRGAKLLFESVAEAKFNEYDDIEHLAIVQAAAPDVFAFFDRIAKRK